VPCTLAVALDGRNEADVGEVEFGLAVKDRAEWNDSDIIFEITRKGGSWFARPWHATHDFLTRHDGVEALIRDWFTVKEVV
jgi:hypothetical protein